MGFYYHLFMMTCMPCIYGCGEAYIAPEPVQRVRRGAIAGKI